MGRGAGSLNQGGGKRRGQSNNNNIRQRGTSLTMKRKDKINHFKNLDESSSGVIGSKVWKRNLYAYMSRSDDAVTTADIERWIKKYAWITSEARRTTRPNAGVPIHRLGDSSPSPPLLTPELSIPPQVNDDHVEMPNHELAFQPLRPDPQYPPQHPDSRFYDPQRGDLPFQPNFGHFPLQSFGPPMGQFLPPPPPPPLPIDPDFLMQRQYHEIQDNVLRLSKSIRQLPELRAYLIPLNNIVSGVQRNHKHLLAPNHGEVFQRFVRWESERAKMENEGQQEDLDASSSSRVTEQPSAGQLGADNTSQQVIDFGEDNNTFVDNENTHIDQIK